jgi:site-specific DNA recombinase
VPWRICSQLSPQPSISDDHGPHAIWVRAYVPPGLPPLGPGQQGPQPDQQKTARKYAEDRGWRVVAEFKDEHMSAFRKIERKDFEALLQAASDGKIDVIIARHQDRLLRHPETYSRLLEICVRRNIPIHLYGSGGFLDLSTSQGGFMGMMNTAIAWQESAIRSERVRAAVERNTRAGKRTGGGSRPFGYKIIRHDQGEGARRRWRIVGEEIEPAEAELIKEAATRVLRGESLRSIALDWNKRGIKTVGASSTKPNDVRTDQDRGARVWHGSMIRRVLVSARIAGLREHHGEVITQDGEPVKAAWPAIISSEEHDRLVGLLRDESRRPANYGRPRVYPLAGLLRCGSCDGKLITYLQRKQGRGYGCRKDENPDCDARVRIAAEPLEAYVEGSSSISGGIPKPSRSPNRTTTEWRASEKSPTRCAICRSKRTRRCG